MPFTKLKLTIAHQDLAALALDEANRLGASYADVRLIELSERSLSTKNGLAGTVSEQQSMGLGLRVINKGSWGFASTDDLTREGIIGIVRKAIEIAEASALTKINDVFLSEIKPYEVTWATPIQVDPFEISINEQLNLLLEIDQVLQKTKGITLCEGQMCFSKEKKLFLSSIGSCIFQTFISSGAGFAALAFKDGDLQKRSYPTSFGGQHQRKGYELIQELQLLDHAPRIAEEAVALLDAPLCPSGIKDLILESSQLGLQIHESIGHPIELDRVLGSEANFAGKSFLNIEKLNNFQYGSDLVHVVADATQDHGPGLGTFAFDDEGVPAQSVDIIREGQFVGYLSSRETSPVIGHSLSGGAMRAENWNHLPLIRMTNVSLLPGEWSLDHLIEDTKEGVYLETNRSWSIDDMRYNFQFGTELGWEIKNGKRTRMVKNPIYSGITPQFWNSLDAICDKKHWTLWGTPNCGKGQPCQVMGTGHGASPSRFRKVSVGASHA